MYGAGSIPAGDHKFLPFFKRYPNQLIFCTQKFFDMENSNLKHFFILTTIETTSSGQNKKNASDSSSPYRKTPENKKIS